MGSEMCIRDRLIRGFNRDRVKTIQGTMSDHSYLENTIDVVADSEVVGREIRNSANTEYVISDERNEPRDSSFVVGHELIDAEARGLERTHLVGSPRPSREADLDPRESAVTESRPSAFGLTGPAASTSTGVGLHVKAADGLRKHGEVDACGGRAVERRLEVGCNGRKLDHLDAYAIGDGSAPHAQHANPHIWRMNVGPFGENSVNNEEFSYVDGATDNRDRWYWSARCNR